MKIKNKNIMSGDEVFIVDLNNLIPDGPYTIKNDYSGGQWVHIVGQKCKQICCVYKSERLAKNECIRNIDRKIRDLISIKKRRLED